MIARLDPTPAATHTAVLRRRGMSAQDIADASGISVTLIRRLLRPPATRPARISRTTADAVLGVPLPTRHTPGTTAGRGLTDAAPAAAILAALAVAGWPATYLATRLRTSTRTLAAVRDGTRPRLAIALDQRIHHLHPQLTATTPADAGIRPADAARTRAWTRRRQPTNQPKGASQPHPDSEAEAHDREPGED